MLKKYPIIINFILTFFIIVFLSLNYTVNADIGLKPSITINLTNIDTQDYLIDLLVYDESGENYNSEMNYNGEDLTQEQIETLYKINYDGWISESTRWSSYLLFPDCSGNSQHEHYFSYFGTPETYKVVIIFDTGEIRITDVINRTDFTSNITLDVNNMKVITHENVSFNVKNIIITLLLTIIVEVVIALIMKFKK